MAVVNSVAYDRVLDRTATTGTGTITLAGVTPTSYRTLASAATTGDVAVLCIYDNLDNWEVTQGTITISAGVATFARTTVLASSNAGSLVNFPSANNTVISDFPAYFANVITNCSGPTLPANPYPGQFFLHTPTGRKILFHYEGSAWRPIVGYGITTYVDSAGSNATNKGTGTGSNAYATLTYAQSQLPPINFGNVAVTVNSSITDSPTIANVTVQPGFTFTITGTTTSLAGPITLVSASTATSGNQATLTFAAATFTGLTLANKWVTCLTNANGTSAPNVGVYRLIDSHTTTTLTCVSTWPGTPQAGDTFRVVEVPVITGGTSVASNQVGLVVNTLGFVSSGNHAVTTGPGAEVTFNNCSFSSGTVYYPAYFNGSNSVQANQCLYVATSGSPPVLVNLNAVPTFIPVCCKLDAGGFSGVIYGFLAASGVMTFLSNLITMTTSAGKGVYGDSGAQVICANPYGKNVLRNLNTGVTAINGAHVKGSVSFNLIDSGVTVTTATSADAATYSSIG